MNAILWMLLLAPVPLMAQPADALSDDFIAFINKKDSIWTAGRNFPKNTTTADLKRLVGDKEAISYDTSSVKILHHDSHYFDKILPDSFDVRDRWPNCSDVISIIRNQGNCDGSWAFAPVSVMTDRTCIETEGQIKFLFSPEDIMTCCKRCKYGDDGCSGGRSLQVWNHWIINGVVSGGDYNSKDGCKPYNESWSPKCNFNCTNSKYGTSYDDDKRFGRSFYRIDEDVYQIESELMMHGSVIAIFTVYSDFFSYQKGVYRHLAGQYVGNYVVRILGWGFDDGVPYWLCANSWGKDWGKLGGFFKVLKGGNECGIESKVMTARVTRRISAREKLVNPNSTSSTHRFIIRCHVAVVEISVLFSIFANKLFS